MTTIFCCHVCDPVVANINVFELLLKRKFKTSHAYLYAAVQNVHIVYYYFYI